jgi:hypothetical protein
VAVVVRFKWRVGAAPFVSITPFARCGHHHNQQHHNQPTASESGTGILLADHLPQEQRVALPETAD